MKNIKIRDLILEVITGEWGDTPIDNGSVCVLRSTNFTNDGFIDYKNTAKRSILSDKIKKKELLSGDVIIEKSGGSPNQPVGRVVYFEKPDNEIYLCNNFTSVLRPNKEKVYPKFLFYLLHKNHRIGKTLKFQNKTTGIINLKLNNYLNENEIIPERIEDQIRIATLLSRIEELIAKRKESIRLLDEFVKSTFLEMFGDPVRASKYMTKSFKEVSIVRQGLQIPISQRKSEPGENRYPYITNQFINGGKIAEFIENPKPNVICKKDDILMTRTGNTGIVITDIDGVFHNNFFLIDYNRDLLNKIYLVNFLKLPHIKKIVLRKASTTTIPDLNHGDFYSIYLPVPPLDIQKKFAKIVEKVESIKLKYQNSLFELEKLYGAVSQRAFRGEI
jgi:type I restriction enzyme, S subunit